MGGKRVSPGSSSVEVGFPVALLVPLLVPVLVPVWDDVVNEEDSDCTKSGGSTKLEIKSPSPRLSDLGSEADGVDSNSGLPVDVSGSKLVIVWFVHWRFTCLG